MSDARHFWSTEAREIAAKAVLIAKECRLWLPALFVNLVWFVDCAPNFFVTWDVMDRYPCHAKQGPTDIAN
jgi:hypothetical protein